MLNINGLSISYGPVQVVHGVTMGVDEGQIVALIGPNGAGKSSVLRVVSGLIRPTAGEINFLGASLVGAPPHEIAMAGIAHVMEGRHLFGGLSVEDNLILAGSGDEKGSAGNLDSVYRRWPILRERREQLAGTLSGGEQQMLAIGRALMSRPRLMILDEPSWGLAPRIVRELMETFSRLRQGGMTIFLCEQMANLALQICDYAYVMTSGRVVLEGSSQELLADPDLQATYLGGEIKEAASGISSLPQEKTGEPGRPREILPLSTERPIVAKADSKEAPVERSEREAVRQERARTFQQKETGGLPDLTTSVPIQATKDRSGRDYAARERRRQMKVRDFEADERHDELHRELTSITKEIGRIGLEKEGDETDKGRAQQGPGPDRKVMEAVRKKQESRRRDLPSGPGPGGSDDMQTNRRRASQEQARREREAAVRRDQRLQEMDPDHQTNIERQKVRSGSGNKMGALSQKYRKRMEEQRLLRQQSRESELRKSKQPEGPRRTDGIKKEPDRKANEFKRRQKQARNLGTSGRN